MQLHYTQWSTPTSPTWTFSNTPNWVAKDWAYSGQNWPEAWDPLKGMVVKYDPIGTYAAIISSGKHLQVMLGVAKLKSYSDLIVRLEGRGYSTNSSAKINIYNPLNNCGVTGVTMAHDWSMHVVEVSLAGCLIAGNNTQAIRVAPTSQGVVLVKMKVTLVGAVY